MYNVTDIRVKNTQDDYSNVEVCYPERNSNEGLVHLITY